VERLYGIISPDINSIIEMLSPVVSEVILCPDNGEWRFVASRFIDNGQVGIFFPWLIPSADGNKSELQKPIAVGVLGNVNPESIQKLCQKLIDIFDTKSFLQYL
jgi:hypothetical protein